MAIFQNTDSSQQSSTSPEDAEYPCFGNQDSDKYWKERKEGKEGRAKHFVPGAGFSLGPNFHFVRKLHSSISFKWIVSNWSKSAHLSFCASQGLAEGPQVALAGV